MSRALPYSCLLSALAFSSFWLPAAPALAASPTAPGVPNFHQVDEHVYRGAQPSAQGWKSLAGLGIKTIIDLRPDGDGGSHSTKAEARAVEAAGMRYVSVPMSGFRAPSNTAVARILAAFNSKDPVFVHCRFGRDRTGTAVACYRIAHDSWSNQKALQEARDYGIHWFEVRMKHYIMAYQPAVERAGSGLAPIPAVAAAP
jgi:tyrosine-protein phosphatase SIW14